MSWLQVLLDFLGRLLPLRVVRSYQQGVRFTFGRASGPLQVGFYWRLPLIWEVEIVSVAEQVLDVASVVTTTADGKVVVLSANIVYAVENGLMAYVNVDLYPMSLTRLAATSLHRVGRRVTWDTLQHRQRAVERRVQRDLQHQATGWGITIRAVGLTDFAPLRAYRLYGGGEPLAMNLDHL